MTFVNTLRFSSAAALACMLPCLLPGASVTWSGADGGDWNNGANWGGTKPGTGDTAVFNSNISSVTNSVADQTLTTIQFGTTSLGSVTIGSTSGNSITLNSGGQIAILNTVTTASLTQTVNSPLILSPASPTNNGSYMFTSNGTVVSTKLVIGGSISGGTTTGAITLTLTGSNAQAQGTNEIKGIISDGDADGGLAIVKNSSAKWILSNNDNSFSGGVTLNSGSLTVTSLGMTGQNSALGTNGTIKVGSGTSSLSLIYTGSGETSDKNFDLTGTTGGVTIYSAGAGGLTLTGNITASGLGAKTLTLRSNGSGLVNTNILSGKISDSSNGATSLAKNDANTWILAGANAYSGSTTIGNGTLQVGNGGTTGTLGTGVVTITNTTSALVFDRSDTIDVSNNIAGSGVLKQIGSGTLNLTGTNTYTGLTTVSDGKLLNNGSIAGAVAVDGGTLGGSGTFGGLVTINSGGTLSPGNSPGLAVFNSGLTLGGTTLLEIAGTGRGISYDAVNVGGTLTYGGDLDIAVTTTLSGGEIFNLFNAVDGTSAPSITGVFSNITLSGSYSGTLTYDSGVWTTLGINGISFSFDQSTGALTTVATPIPEPATYAAILGGLAIFGAILRRRRRS